MARNEQLELRARFLHKAAHLLAVPAPAAAAELGGACQVLVEDTEGDISTKDLNSLRREACGACGNIMIPGWSCKVSTRSQPGSSQSQRRDAAKPSARIEGHVVYECLRCHRHTTQALQSKPRRRVGKPSSHTKAKQAADVSTLMKDDSDKIPRTVNASSKQRQKARKGGLQAMLERNKSQSSNTGGFDLMDFAM